LTGVTAPLVRQSTASAVVGGSITMFSSDSSLLGIGVGESAWAAHSVCVMAENWFTPMRKVWRPRASSSLCFLIVATVASKMLLRCAISSAP
jgi:hypothetical protein